MDIDKLVPVNPEHEKLIIEITQKFEGMSYSDATHILMQVDLVLKNASIIGEEVQSSSKIQQDQFFAAVSELCTMILKTAADLKKADQ